MRQPDTHTQRERERALLGARGGGNGGVEAEGAAGAAHPDGWGHPDEIDLGDIQHRHQAPVRVCPAACLDAALRSVTLRCCPRAPRPPELQATPRVADMTPRPQPRLPARGLGAAGAVLRAPRLRPALANANAEASLDAERWPTRRWQRASCSRTPPGTKPETLSGSGQK
jgi:hypothetical protein